MKHLGSIFVFGVKLPWVNGINQTMGWIWADLASPISLDWAYSVEKEVKLFKHLVIVITFSMAQYESLKRRLLYLLKTIFLQT